MLNIFYTELADADLIGIYIYTYETWGESQAVRYSDALKAAIYRLAEEPRLPGTLDRSGLYPGCRSYLVKRHLILYRVVEDSLEVVRILHGRMDIPSRIAEFYDQEEW